MEQTAYVVEQRAEARRDAYREILAVALELPEGRILVEQLRLRLAE